MADIDDADFLKAVRQELPIERCSKHGREFLLPDPCPECKQEAERGVLATVIRALQDKPETEAPDGPAAAPPAHAGDTDEYDPCREFVHGMRSLRTAVYCALALVALAVAFAVVIIRALFMGGR